MKEDNKRWLLSVMKTSGSKREYVINGSFSEERNTKKYQDIENLPQHESFGSTLKEYNGKLNYGLLVRFLRGQVGNNWDDVYSEIISRIPTKLLDHKEIVFWFVADKIELIKGHPYNSISNKFIWTSEQGEYNFTFDNSDFYVCPSSNKLLRVEDKPSKRITKNLGKTELRKYRESEKNKKAEGNKRKKQTIFDTKKSVEQILSADNKLKN